MAQLDLAAERESDDRRDLKVYDQVAQFSERLDVSTVELAFGDVGRASVYVDRTFCIECDYFKMLLDEIQPQECGDALGPALWNRVGQLAAITGEVAAAPGCFERAIDQLTEDGDRKIVLQNLLIVQLALADVNSAEETLRRIARLNSDNPWSGLPSRSAASREESPRPAAPPSEPESVPQESAVSASEAQKPPDPVVPQGQLEIRKGPQKGRRCRFRTYPIVLGRGGDCDLVFDDPMVSRRHAQLCYENDAWAIEVLQSRSGTFVNERRVENRARLSDGDCIRIADVELWFSLPQKQAPSPCMAEAEPRSEARELPEEERTPPYLDENVQFTVYRPRSVVPQKWYPLLAFAHLSDKPPEADEDELDPVEEVRRQATAVLGERAEEFQDTTQDSSHAVPRESELTMVPAMEGAEFNPERRTFTWQESVHREEFRMRAKPELVGKTARGRLTVFLGSIILAEVPLAIRVVVSEEPRAEQKLEPQSARAYRKIFASYSHRDLPIVEQFERYIEMLGDEYLRDWKHLRAGQEWNARLMELIREADVFQLFWSTNSMRSPYVRQEWEYALSLSRPNFVRPTYWEDPLPRVPEDNLPPESLSRLHFQRLGAAAPAESQTLASKPSRLTANIVKASVEEMKRRIVDRLTSDIDVSAVANMDEATLCRELRTAAEALSDREEAILTRGERDRLVEECLKESICRLYESARIPERFRLIYARCTPFQRSGGCGNEADAAELKRRLRGKLFGKMDLSAAGQIDPAVLRHELRMVAEHIMDHEDVSLSQAERDRLIEECLDESLSPPAPPKEKAAAPRRHVEFAMRGGDDAQPAASAPAGRRPPQPNEPPSAGSPLWATLLAMLIVSAVAILGLLGLILWTR